LGLLRSRRRDATRYRAARPERTGGRRRARHPLPDVVRRRPEACRRAGAGRPGHQGTHRSTQGRPDQHRGPPPGARSPRRVRSDVARSDRPHDRPHHTHGGGTTMTVTAVHKDPDALTMILTAEFDASPERVWDLWADPRKLERWWGPPYWPATFTAHDLAPGSH